MRNTTLSLFANRIPDSFDARRTVTCCGVPLGGTSMVDGTIHGLGAPIGDSSLPNNIEDPLFNHDYLKSKAGTFNKVSFHNQVREEFTERNSRHNVWGWKYSRVNTYRDPVPIAMRSIGGMGENSDEQNARLLRKMKTRLRMYQANVKMIERWQIPTLMVLYDLATMYKGRYLGDLAAFIRQPLPDYLGPLLDFIAPGSYKTPLAL